MIDKNKNTPSSDFPSGFPTESLKEFDATYARMLLAINGSNQEHLASFLGISKDAIYKAIRSQKIPPAWFFTIGRKANISVDWLDSGLGPMRRGEAAAPAPPAPPAPAEVFLAAPQEEFRMSDMVTKTIEVLESDTIYRTALASNINAFHQAVRSERTLARLEERMADLEAKSEAMLTEIGELRRGNRELKQRLEPTGQDKAVGAEG